MTFSLFKLFPLNLNFFFIFCKKTESDKMETRPISWPSVKTTITPFHYAYIAVTLSFLFPPEVAESITRLTKKCDEAQNLLDHHVLYVHTYMLNTLKNVSLSPFSGMLLSEVCPSQGTVNTKKYLTSHIWRIGRKVNNPQQIPAWHDSLAHTKTVSERMIDSIIKENNYSWGETIGHNCDYIKLYCINTCWTEKEEEKDYKKIAKKEKKERNKMLKLQTPKEKIKFSKNQPSYSNQYFH